MPDPVTTSPRLLNPLQPSLPSGVRVTPLGRDLLSGDAVRRMTIRVEPASRQASAASAFRKLSRLVAAAAGDRYAR